MLDRVNNLPDKFGYSHYLDNAWILLGGVTGQSPLGVKGLTSVGWLYHIYNYQHRLLEF